MRDRLRRDRLDKKGAFPYLKRRGEKVMRRLVRTLWVIVLAAGASLLAVQSPAALQEGHVVEAKAVLSKDAVHPGETFLAAVILKVNPPYHINDSAPLDEFMFPTSLTFEDGPFKAAETVYPPGHKGKFAYSEVELIVYEGETTLGARFKAKDDLPPGDYKIKAALSYQACDNTSCLPPKELAFEVPVKVVPVGTATQDINAETISRVPFKKEGK